MSKLGDHIRINLNISERLIEIKQKTITKTVRTICIINVRDFYFLLPFGFHFYRETKMTHISNKKSVSKKGNNVSKSKCFVNTENCFIFNDCSNYYYYYLVFDTRKVAQLEYTRPRPDCNQFSRVTIIKNFCRAQNR